MQIEDTRSVLTQSKIIRSAFLQREVRIDLYLPATNEPPALLLVNDGQDLEQMDFARILHETAAVRPLRPLLCVGIHAGDRKHEYGTARELDFAGRGVHAKDYQRFLFRELLPFLLDHTGLTAFPEMAIAGFSLGGLSALDTAWNHPGHFRLVGVFSGSLWWRSRGLDDGYEDDRDRIMHQQVRRGRHRAGLRFYFTTGSLDETADRNHNGTIDSIDDTQDLIRELEQIGYTSPEDLCYINYEDGRHDVATWARALPAFLDWGWGCGS